LTQKKILPTGDYLPSQHRYLVQWTSTHQCTMKDEW
jgi:hypothetical protein